MKTITIKILDERAMDLLKILEDLGVIRIHSDVETENTEAVDPVNE